MKKLIIIGAGGFGREVYWWALDVQKISSEWKISGFLDENLRALEIYDNYPPIIGSPKDYQPNEEEVFICAIGNAKQKIEICQHLESAGAHFTSLIHPTVILGGITKIGRGCILCPRVVVTADVSIGNHVILNVSASVGHDVVIGNGCTINAHSDVNGFARIGQGVYVGSHASILPNTEIGDFAKVGAGSVAIRTVKSGNSVFGVPAIKIGES